MKSDPRGNKPRNPLHDHPLLRKGGEHRKSRKAERRGHKVGLKGEWGPHSACLASVAPAPFAARGAA